MNDNHVCCFATATTVRELKALWLFANVRCCFPHLQEGVDELEHFSQSNFHPVVAVTPLISISQPTLTRDDLIAVDEAYRSDSHDRVIVLVWKSRDASSKR
jgi:hypothetical protein